MPRIEFPQLPEDARVWIFSAERPLDRDEQARLMADVDAFIDQWGAVDSPFCPPVLTSVANGCKRPRRSSKCRIASCCRCIVPAKYVLVCAAQRKKASYWVASDGRGDKVAQFNRADIRNYHLEEDRVDLMEQPSH